MAADALGHAAAARHQRAVERAEQALRDLDHEGAPISFQAVARRASVSRQWLYTPGCARRSSICATRHRLAATGSPPAHQRATEASRRQQVETLRAENKRLREENTSLKTELAIAYGSRRDTAGKQEPSLDR